MHTLLQQLGRDIVKKESLKDPGKRQFIWDTKEISNVLGDEDTVRYWKNSRHKLDTFTSSWKEDIQISKSAFQGMKNLLFLVLDSDNVISEGLSCLPNKLRLIEWRRCPLTFLPSNFSGKFLVELTMTETKLEKLWDEIKPLQRLKRMVLSNSWYLKEIPDLSNATSLEELDLHGCESLLELTSTIGNATKLKRCKLSDCFLLKELPSSMGRLINLQELDLTSTGLKELEKLSSCSRLKILDLSWTLIWEVPSSIRSNWSCFNMSGCINLEEFPNVPDSIEELVLCKTSIEEIPPWIENLSHLRKLIMYGCKNLKKISPNISKLENLEFLGLGKKDEREHDTSDFGKLKHVSEAVIEWEGPGPKRSWTLISDFKVHYILPRCLPTTKKALSLCLGSYGLKTTPDCITRLSGPIKLDVRDCTLLEALGPLPNSLLSIDAEYRYHLKSIDSSFQSSNSCLNFAGCVSLNQNAKELIYTSDCKYALLPGKEVPAHFPHQAASGSLTINLTPRPLPSSLRFKACILLSKFRKFRDDTLLMGGVSCHVMGKHNGFTVQYGSNQHHMPCKYKGYADHLYIFEDSFCLNQDCPEAEDATLSELVFEFICHGKSWKVKGCGVRLLVPDDVDVYNSDGVVDEDDSDDDGESTLVLVEEVPAHFTYQATSHSLTINQTPQPLPPSLRFKACILLSRRIINYLEDVSWRLGYLFDDDYVEDEKLLMRVSCWFRSKQNGLTVQYGSYMRDTPYLYGSDDFLYTFEDYICLDQDLPEAAEEATFSKLVFEFKVFYKKWEVKACGVQLLEDDEVGEGDNDGVQEDIKVDVDKNQEGEKSRRGDDGETRSTKRVRFSLP
ncbi:hypothetical protein DY000_02018634 [Brassica cretica]|uniref:C-JID domain-containing protein n=1 Tax=Brassica cretica TaxID=69181 RepID=A0ABQ7CWU1_BRACR|nr:hypothetical protein DY000_02018634 [Brassica cretica]